MGRYFIECRHVIQGQEPRWERIALGEGHDEGYTRPEDAKDALAKIKTHPSVLDAHLVYEEESNG